MLCEQKNKLSKRNSRAAKKVISMERFAKLNISRARSGIELQSSVNLISEPLPHEEPSGNFEAQKTGNWAKLSEREVR